MEYVGETFTCGPRFGEWVGPIDSRLRHGYLFRIVLLIAIGALPATRLCPEVKDRVCRRWRLACSLGAQTASEEFQTYKVLGWDHPVHLYRSRLGMFEIIIRFVHRGNCWRSDFLNTDNIVNLFELYDNQ